MCSGLLDFATGLCFAAVARRAGPAERARSPDKPYAWRQLDVAVVQHLIVEEICQPEL
jgi:hypothetical protein